MVETSFKGSDFTRSLILLKVNHVILYINYTSIKKKKVNPVVSPCQSSQSPHHQENRGNNKGTSILDLILTKKHLLAIV